MHHRLKQTFSPILQLQAQKNYRNLEFRREILEFRKKYFDFHGANLEISLSLEEKSSTVTSNSVKQKSTEKMIK